MQRLMRRRSRRRVLRRLKAAQRALLLLYLAVCVERKDEMEENILTTVLMALNVTIEDSTAGAASKTKSAIVGAWSGQALGSREWRDELLSEKELHEEDPGSSDRE